MLYEGWTELLPRSTLMHIVDRVGGGDSFGGGLILRLLKRLRSAVYDRVRSSSKLLKAFC